MKDLNRDNDTQTQELRDFDVVDGEIEGTSIKQFKLCLGKSLREMYDDIKSDPNTHYVTCVDDLIKTCTPEEFDKVLVSVVKKLDREPFAKTNFQVSAELICSRLTNLFGVKTPYIAPVKDDPRSVLSVDFLKNIPDKNNAEYFKSQQMITFNELTDTEVVASNSDISVWITLLTKTLLKPFAKVTTQQLNNIIIDFIRMFIVRSMIFDDYDLNGGNVCMVYTDDYSDLSLGPAFDFEYGIGNSTFFMRMNRTKPNNFIENNFRYLLENWPEQTNLAMKTLGITQEKLEQIKTIIYEFSPTLSFANRANFIVSENLKKVNGVYNSLLANTKQTLEIN